MRRRANATFGRFAPIGALAGLCLLLANCSNGGGVDARYGVSPSPRVIGDDQPVPKGGGVYRVGSPYVVGGRVYVPEDNPRYAAVGLTSWYGSDFHGRMTANGEVFDLNGISAAHPTLPLPSYVRVTNLTNGKSLIVRVNDRGPYAHNRIIDVSTRAAHLLGFYNRGTVPVRVEYVGRAPVEGSDDRILEATLRDHEPAPAPWNVKLASTSIIPPFPRQPAPVSGPRFLGAPATTASTGAAMSFAATPSSVDGVDLLNGRGLY
jgi:peptidoglycan lytic transglycosylase